MLTANYRRQAHKNQLFTSVNIFGSIQLNHFIFGYSYDINTPKLGNTRGVHELSLIWQIGRECSSCDNYLVKHPWGRNY